MKNSNLKVIGTNSLTKHLENKSLSCPNFAFEAKNRCFVDCFDNDEKYLLEVKIIRFIEGEIIVEGFIADKNSNFGRIS